MVDATMKDDARGHLRRTARPDAAAAVEPAVVISADAAAYPAEAPAAVWAPAQSPEWVRAWSCEAASETLVASLVVSGRVAMSLPLEIVRKGPLRLARFMGGSHANGNFPYLDATARVDADALRRLAGAIRRSRPDIDLLLLERLAPDIGGTANPLLQLRHSRSPNVALAVSLADGFQGVLGRASSRKSKRYRSQLRKFEALGGGRRITASNEAEVDRLLDAFFEMKAARFRTMGVADVFGGQDVQAFFRGLFKASLASAAPEFTLTGLEVGGKLRAVTGHSRCGKRLICEFAGMADDDLAQHSPGHFLFYENIRAAADAGYGVYDFSVGDEPYKRAWCDMEQVQFDVLVPLSAKGRALAASLRAGSRLKGLIKKNPPLWNALKRVRQILRGRPKG